MIFVEIVGCEIDLLNDCVVCLGIQQFDLGFWGDIEIVFELVGQMGLVGKIGCVGCVGQRGVIGDQNVCGIELVQGDIMIGVGFYQGVEIMGQVLVGLVCYVFQCFYGDWFVQVCQGMVVCVINGLVIDGVVDVLFGFYCIQMVGQFGYCCILVQCVDWCGEVLNQVMDQCDQLVICIVFFFDEGQGVIGQGVFEFFGVDIEVVIVECFVCFGYVVMQFVRVQDDQFVWQGVLVSVVVFEILYFFQGQGKGIGIMLVWCEGMIVEQCFELFVWFGSCGYLFVCVYYQFLFYFR